MSLELLMVWIMMWIIFLVLSIIEKRGVTFGFLSGLWILFLGVYIYVDGLQILSGASITASGTTQDVTYAYSNIVSPFSNYGLLWGIPFVLLGIYITYLASTKMSN